MPNAFSYLSNTFIHMLFNKNTIFDHVLSNQNIYGQVVGNRHFCQAVLLQELNKGEKSKI